MFDSPELKTLSRYVRSYLGGLKTLCVEVDKQEWKYLEGGKGETVLFLHGAGGSKTQWRSMMQEYLQDYRVIAIDVPGLNVNQPFRFRRHSCRQYGLWLAKVLDQLRLEKVHLVGTSLGGTIAAYFAAQYPQRVESLALLAFPNVLGAGERESSQALQGFLDATRMRTVQDVESAYARAFYKSPSVPKLVLRYNLRESQKHQETLQSVLRELLDSRPVLMAGLRQIKVPSLILHGIEDRMCAAVGADFWQRQIPHAQYQEIPECGHMIHIEKPEDASRLHRQLVRNAGQLARQVRDDDETGRFSILK